MAQIDFLAKMHSRTRRDYKERVIKYDKADCAEIACQFGRDYWDGDRQYGYGGYSYDGRWLPLAQDLVTHYGLKPGDRILDVGCGKGYLLYEFTQALPGVEIVGLDISQYGIDHAKEEIKPFLHQGSAATLPFDDNEFDFVVSLGTLHNLGLSDVWQAISEIERVGKTAKKYIMVESFRDEREKANLLYWQLTCQSFHGANDWSWLFKKAGYSGDYGFIYFE